MPLQRRTPMSPRTIKRWKGLERSGRLKPFSAKREAQREERRAFVERILRERPTCEGLFCMRQVVGSLDIRDQARMIEAMRTCSFRSSEVHEKLKRSRGGSITDDDNVLALCHFCHGFTELEPRLATIAGMLTPSWKR